MESGATATVAVVDVAAVIEEEATYVVIPGAGQGKVERRTAVLVIRDLGAMGWLRPNAHSPKSSIAFTLAPLWIR